MRQLQWWFINLVFVSDWQSFSLSDSQIFTFLVWWFLFPWQLTVLSTFLSDLFSCPALARQWNYCIFMLLKKKGFTHYLCRILSCLHLFISTVCAGPRYTLPESDQSQLGGQNHLGIWIFCQTSLQYEKPFPTRLGQTDWRHEDQPDIDEFLQQVGLQSTWLSHN